MNIKRGLLIGDLSSGRLNNFDFLRFFAATLVIISHSVPLSYGNSNREILFTITHGQITTGTFAVYIFFIVSGFLITQSWDRSKNIFKFLKSRILRIFPGIVVVVILSVFILGPIFTSYKLINYFKDINTYKYLCSISLVKMHYTLPGVFSNNAYKNVINGSLWTLMYEFGCYAIITFLGKMKMLNKKSILFIFIVCYIFYVIKLTENFIIITFIRLLTYFIAGSVIYFFRDVIRLNFYYAVGFVLLLIISTKFGILEKTAMILLPYIIIYFVFCPKIKFNKFASRGDFSYGLYIYAYPIQQIIVNLFGGTMQWYSNFLIAFPFVLLCSVMSWYLIEKPCIKLKHVSVRHFIGLGSKYIKIES